MELVTTVYKVTRTFPRDEQFGLTSQVRRAAVSVASNIAEGQARLTQGEFRHFLGQARGSLMELQTQIQIAQNLDYLAEAQASSFFEAAGEVGRLLNGLLNSLGEK
jgi:four helix bundle protein